MIKELKASLKELYDHGQWMGSPPGYSWKDFKEMFDRAEALLKKSEASELDLLESKLQLHQRLEILYVVDGYLATFSDRNGYRELYEAHGETILEAIQNLQPMVEGYTRAQLANPPNIKRALREESLIERRTQED